MNNEFTNSTYEWLDVGNRANDFRASARRAVRNEHTDATGASVEDA